MRRKIPHRGGNGARHSTRLLPRALARDLARSIGAELTLESGPGEGACFRLSLPGLLRHTDPLRHRRPEPGR